MKKSLCLILFAGGLWAQQTMTINGVTGQVVVLPVPTASALGGVESIVQTSNNWVQYIDTSGVPHLAQPAFSNISGVCTSAQGCTGVNNGTATITLGTSSLNFATLSTGIVKNTTTTGALTVATAADVDGVNYVAGSGTANAQTAAYSPAITALVNGLDLCWLPAAANTTTTPTFAPNALTAKTITKVAGAALVASDLTTTAIACAIYDGTNWELQNPQTSGSGVSSVTGSAPISSSGGATPAISCPTCATAASGGSMTTSGAFGITFTATAATAVTLPTSGTLAVLGLNTFTKTQTLAVNTVASGSTPAFDLSLGNVQYVSALATNATPSFSNITAGGHWEFIVCNNATGGYTWTWPASVHGGMTLGTTASKCTNQTFWSPDGSTLYGGFGLINQ